MCSKLPLCCKKLKRGKNERCLIMHDDKTRPINTSACNTKSDIGTFYGCDLYILSRTSSVSMYFSFAVCIFAELVQCISYAFIFLD